ncbi:hypothetical protein EVJ58_g474 [Rhodofomes roseus]|uniref:Uncharacterized protein n=1 Tax=Rhodofomes roseus TaxID=34475 RepID=A0A4Y9Z3Y7_9APHY|nr:hypothetical protein EVJ58_g474 [Rhodofomes roseus]
MIHAGGLMLPIISLLQKQYNSVLACLPRLRTVRLSGAYVLGGRVSLQSVRTAWRGECGDCCKHHLTDADFVSRREADDMAEPRPPALREVIWSFTPFRTPEDYTDGDVTSDSSDYGDTDFHNAYTTGDEDDTDDSNADDEDADSSDVEDSSDDGNMGDIDKGDAGE